ncbi:uncharacterized protein LOC127286011 [Leptopilina boulardi]|uniref:uncharacterized protein LOC127286011 n=1 Tax=Leptopilina boulardi TaxID=63433 RepID=UPI0021F5EBC2|nr:uncharacterized protein LOC127286011 [Leptopilina boulardi]
MDDEIVNDKKMTENTDDIDEDSKLWLEEYLIPKLKVVLNHENSVTKYEVKSSEPLLMSSMIFLELKLIDKREEKNFRLVLKRPHRIELMRQVFQADKFFHNEILFYEKYQKNSKDYPKCFYTDEDPPINSVIVIENINENGYYQCPEKVNLKMKYIVAAMQEIGKFHAKAYVLKHKSPREFFQIVNNIQETRYEYRERNFFPIMMNNLMPRIIKCLRDKNYDTVFCDGAEKFFENAFDNCMRVALNSKMSLATLCHGDFTVNNVFFKESEFGVKAMLFDFAMISYGSPAIDLSTFIYLSMSPDDIRTKFTQVFDAYYNSLMDYFKEINFSEMHSKEFSKENFLNNYKRYAIFGFMIASFYLPIMHGVELPNFDFSTDMENAAEHFKDIGGDKFRDLLMEIFLDMRNSGCLDHIVSNKELNNKL